jgi:flavin reductase (DIM6/NTAB) family NADH-FMN oxidoreductase RutF
MNEQAKSDLLHKLPYGLYVMTAEADGERGGMLVTWVMQASFSPPLVAVAVKGSAHTTSVMKRSGAFALNFMSDEQRKEAGSFGQKYAKVGDKFGNYAATPGPVTGSPILEGGMVTWSVGLRVGSRAGITILCSARLWRPSCAMMCR